jgi:16S rRNA processing protein RimM
MGGSPDPFERGVELLWIGGGRVRELRLSGRRPHGERLLLSFEGITDVEAARRLSGGALCLPGERLPRGPEDFYWTHELQGFVCEDPSGNPLGRVRLLEETVAGPQLTLLTGEGREVLVPFVRPIVVSVEVDSRRIILDLPEGLMEL